METEKIVINPGFENQTVIIREGAAEKVLDPKPPVKANISGTLKSPLEYLLKRDGQCQFERTRCHILVNREDLSIKLVINDHDEYLKGEISGSLEFTKIYKDFGINSSKKWSPTVFGKFVKMNRSFFTDKASAMALVTELMNFKATVDSKVERELKENGGKTDNFSQVVISNLPASFKVKLQIFKGSPVEEIEIETFADIDGREVSFSLISPGANESLENIRDTAIDAILEQVIANFPEIAIIEK